MNTTSQAATPPRIPFAQVLLGSALLLPVAVFAFWPSYFGLFGDLPAGITARVHVHGALMFLWLVMIVLQAWLIRTGRYRSHRRVGRSSFAIVPLIVLSGLYTTHGFFNKSAEDELLLRSIDFITLGQLVAFPLTWWLAIVYRRQPALHVRYIVSTGFAIASAVVFRIFIGWIPGFEHPYTAVVANGVVLVMMLLVLIALDRRKGIRRSPYWVITVALVTMHVGCFTVGRTEAWLGFCRWFAALGA